MKYLLMFLLVASCSQMNNESHVYFHKKKKFKHGLMPIKFDANTEIVPFDKYAAQRGKKIYVKNCMLCHGKEGKGDGPLATKTKQPRNLRKIIKEVPSFQFYLKVSQLSSNMPGWKNYFSDQDIRDVSQYLRSLAR